MPDYSTLIGSSRFETGTVDASNSRGASITTGASANTKGNWAEVLDSAEFSAGGVWTSFTPGTVGEDYLFDLGAGPSGQEVALIENILISMKQDTGTCVFFFPIPVPEGTRLVIRGQASGGASRVYYCTVITVGLPFLPSSPLGRVTTYGANEGDSGGVSIDPGATVNTKGGYVEIVSSTTFDTKCLLIALGHGTNFGRSTYKWLLDVAIGPSGAEKALIENYPIACNVQGDDIRERVLGPFPVAIPAGSRVAIQAQCSGNDASDRLFDAVLYGVD